VAVVSDVPLLGQPGNFEELEQSFASLQVWLGSQTAAIAAFQTSTSSALAGISQTPVGSITAFGATSPPNGWLVCNGSAISRSTYAALFDVIGVNYGPGNGTTTFNLPDLRGRFPLGVAAAGTGSTIGASGGSLDHAHSVPALSVPALSVPALSVPALSVSITTDSQGAHAHTNPDVTNIAGSTGGEGSIPIAFGGDANVAPYDHIHSQANTGSTGNHTHSVSGNTGTGSTGTGSTGTGSTGTGTSGTANPAFLTVSFIIFANV
jgi:microcystin-dependent protein